MLDVLNFMRHTGLGYEKDGSTHTIGAYAKVPHQDEKTLKLAAWMFGGLYVGAWLPQSAAEQMRAKQTWDVVQDPSSEPGSWGGHAMHTVAYSPSAITFATWG